MAAKTSYIVVEVASQRGYTQVKVNGHTEYKSKFDAFRSAPLVDVMATRIELLKLLRILDEAASARREAELKYGFHSNHGLNKSRYVKKR